jgi:hypothetical protein
MGTRVCPSTVYREHNIVFNPSGKTGDSLSDAFLILQPTANPMFTSVLYEHPKEKIQVYSTDEEAYDSAMRQARAWIDAHLDRRDTPVA